MTRRVVAAGLIASLLLGLFSVPALAMKTGPEDVSQLPAGSKARSSFEEIAKVMGAGWPTPYTLTVVSNHGPLTKPAVLAEIYKFEQKIAHNKNVSSVTGSGQVYSTSTQLQSFGPQLRHSAAVSDQSKRDLLKLIDGLSQAGAGSAKLQSGLASASSGASQLQSGSGQAGSGAGQLHSGLTQAHAGSAKLQAGLSSALGGAVALEHGSAQALSGARQLVAGLGQAQAAAKPSVPALQTVASLTATTSSQVNTALAALQAMTTGKNDPRYAAALNALTAASGSAAGSQGLAAAVSEQAPALISGLNQLHTGAAQLQAGIDQLHGGNRQLADGIGQLSGGGGQLTSGLSQLTAGAQALQTGLGQLTNGAGQLAGGLDAGVGPAGQLTTGLATMRAAVTKSRVGIPSTAQLKELQAQSPGLFSSGYFVLAAVDGATHAARTAATFTMNLDRGGTAGQITVFPKYRLNDPRTMKLDGQLTALSRSFARTHDLQVAVGGPAGNLHDLTSVTKSNIWLAVAAIALAITFVLSVALRAVALPMIATLLGLLASAATFGVLELLFGGSSAPMGGPGYLDPVTIISVFTLTFGITTVFSTLLLMRARDAFLAGSDTTAAVRAGLRDTAASTAAGLLMIAAAIPFSLSGLRGVRELAIGVAAATLLGVLAVRPVLLPAAAAVLGRHGWWPTIAGRRGARRGREAATQPLRIRPRVGESA
jgi:X-X-X-Leu-X-X-Gly heptad repeat protein